MNETDNPRSERRRSSRGRRRRSGGGDRSAQSQSVGNTGKPQPAANTAQNPKQNQNRQAKPARPAGERQGRGKDKSARSAEAPRGDRNANRQKSRGDRPEQIRSVAASPARERFNTPRIAPPTLPKPLCPRCGAPIEDLPSALNDKASGAPIHFDCVLARLSESESLAEGEKIVYLGGGRFGVVLFENPGDLKRFRVRKLIQWEEKEKRADWRREVSDLYSST